MATYCEGGYRSRGEVKHEPIRVVERPRIVVPNVSIAEIIERGFLGFHSSCYSEEPNPQLSIQYLLTYFGHVGIVPNIPLVISERHGPPLMYGSKERILEPWDQSLCININQESLSREINFESLWGTDTVFKRGLVHMVLTHKPSGAVLKVRGKPIPPFA